jgi:hypothetical protein
MTNDQELMRVEVTCEPSLCFGIPRIGSALGSGKPACRHI